MSTSVGKISPQRFPEVLGRAVERRRTDVVATVVGVWSARHARSGASDNAVIEVISHAAGLATELVARYLLDSTVSNQAEKRQLASSGAMAALHGYALTDATRNFLTWRDAMLGVVDEEGRRLGLTAEVCAAAAAVVRASADSGLMGMVREFDIEREEVRERLAAEHAKLSHLALHDPLTGLPNRTLLLDRLSHASSGTARDGRRVAVLFLDLNGFKAVNDRYGHRTGDQLLVTIAECLTSIVRPSDTVARMGGDEFVVLCDDFRGGDEGLAALAGRIRRGVTAACADHHGLMVTASIGAVFVDASSGPERALVEADAAMYADKHLGTKQLDAKAEPATLV